MEIYQFNTNYHMYDWYMRYALSHLDLSRQQIYFSTNCKPARKMYFVEKEYVSKRIKLLAIVENYSSYISYFLKIFFEYIYEMCTFYILFVYK